MPPRFRASMFYQTEVPRLQRDELTGPPAGEGSAAIRGRVAGPAFSSPSVCPAREFIATRT
jgi:hypothetical protein